MSATKWSARTITELIIEVWEALDCESVGAAELEQIQHALLETFGAGAAESPAAIARTVADEGAVLRHPEVFDCDLKWRRKNLGSHGFGEPLDFSNLKSAFESVVKIEERRLETDSDPKAIEKLQSVVLAARDELSLKARSRILDEGERQASNEVAQWLTVWLRTPELFSDWLDLRRRSPEFQKNFPES